MKEHRDVHSLISKLGKEIDKAFVMEFGSVIGEVHSLEDPESKRCVLRAIHECLVQHGQLSAARELEQVYFRFPVVSLLNSLLFQEADNDGCPFISDMAHTVNYDVISELNEVVRTLKKEHNTQPALKWCQEHKESLDRIGSSIEFELHRLMFVDAFKKRESFSDPLTWRKEMLKLAKNLSPFTAKHATAVRQLMGCLAFVGTPSGNSPEIYENITADSWEDIGDLLYNTACQVVGLPKKSAVETAIAVGCKAVPPLFQIIQVVQKRQCQGFLRDMESELPIEISLPEDFIFHSIFACPILKQQTTSSNPPLRLACGHVISREVLSKLAIGNRIRCPYCPNIDQNPNDARPVFF